MNKNRQPVTKETRKKLSKEVKKGQKLLEIEEAPIRSDKLKVTKKQKPLVDSTVKGMEIKKKIRKAAHSKRTTPGELTGQDMSNAHVHPEGERWAKTLTLQSKTKSRNLAVKLQKRASKRKIK